MTIKQLGGVFGRNPTFNDVTIEGTLTLEDTTSTSTDVVGPEQVTNGTFDTDLSGWIVSGSGTVTWVSGQAELSDAVNFRQEPVTTDSGAFLISWDQTITAGTRTRLRIRNSAGSADVGPFNYYNGSGSKSIIVPTTAGLTLQFITEAGNTALLDNVSVKQFALIANLDDGVIVDNLQVEGVLSSSQTALNPALQFNIGASEAMRVDSSGNLLVGTTDTTLYNNTSGGGFHASANGFTEVAYESANATDPAFIFNNTGDDGDIIQLRKDGAQAGSIGVDYLSRIFIKSNSVGFFFNAVSDTIQPYGTSDLRDAGIDLGSSSYRFKDLYLSGGVNQSTVLVSALPAAASSTGYRFMVSDSTVAASGNFGATVAGSGSNVVPVFSDGTNWLIG